MATAVDMNSAQDSESQDDEFAELIEMSKTSGVLELDNFELDDEDVADLAGDLSHWVAPQLEVDVLLNGVGLDDNQMSAVMEGLQGAHLGRIKRLDLSGNSIRGESLQAIVDVCRTHRVRELYVRLCPIVRQATETLFEELPTTEILGIGLTSVFVDTASLEKALLHSDCKCKFLLLNYQDLDQDDCVHLHEVVKGNRTLTGLYLDNNRFASMEWMSALASNQRLRWLELTRTGLDDEAAERLGEALASAQLEWLNASINRITDRGMVHMCRPLASSVLRTLVVTDNAAIGDASGEALAAALSSRSCRLEELMLQRNSIGDKGVHAMAQALENNVSLRVLDLSMNPFGDAGLASMAHMVLSNQALNELYLVGSARSMCKETSLVWSDAVRSNRQLLQLSLAPCSLEGASLIECVLRESHDTSNIVCLSLAGQHLSLMSHEPPSSQDRFDLMLRAAECGDVAEMARLHYVHGISLNASRTVSLDEERLLNIAVERNDLTMARFLVCHAHTDIHHTNQMDATCMDYARRDGKLAMLELLERRGAMLTDQWCTELGVYSPDTPPVWTRERHWMCSSAADEAMETVLVLNDEERELMFEAGGMDGYVPSAKWMTLPDEVMERVVGWMGVGYGWVPMESA